jgi:hypothetical protein
VHYPPLRPSFLRWSGSRGVADPKSESLEPADTPEPQQSVVVVGGTLDMVIDNLVSLGVMGMWDVIKRCTAIREFIDLSGPILDHEYSEMYAI